MGQTDETLSGQLLDEILTDSVLSQWFPSFQASVPIDHTGIVRIHNALDWEIAPIRTYKELGHSFLFQAINDHDLATLLLKLLSKKSGAEVALEILYSRIRMNDENQLGAELITAGREILVSYNFSHDVDKRLMDEHLSNVAKICLVGNDAVESAIRIGHRLLEFYKLYLIDSSDFDDYFAVLGELQSTVFLDIFVDSDNLEDYQRQNLFSNHFGKNKNALHDIPDSIILSWCEVNSHVRYERICSLIDTYFYDHESSQLEWKPITLSMLEKAPNVEKILYALSDSIRPTSWSGSRADILQQRFPLLESLFQHVNAEVSAWARRAYIDLQSAIVQEREWEREKNHQQDESFEW